MLILGNTTTENVFEGTSMSLRETLSNYWQKFQAELFPFLDEAIGPLTASHRQLVVVLDMLRPEVLVRHWHGAPGRPASERAALARAFVAKAGLNLPTTAMLIERVHIDKTLRHLCGWQSLSQVPSEATFSRAFAEFAASQLPARLHEALIWQTHGDRLVGHIARDSTAIQGREKPHKPKQPKAPVPAKKRGRPKKDEPRPAQELRRIAQQAAGMGLAEMLADLPRHCDTGVKRNAKGYQESWTGFKLHIDTADGDIPVGCILTSASVHDSQVAIPLSLLTAARLTSCYDLMDSAYDVPEIRQHSLALGHVAIIDINPRRNAELKQHLVQEYKRQTLIGHTTPEALRYNERSSAERVNGNLKDNHGGRTVRVRGADKVMCHLMFGIAVIAVAQILRLVT